MTIIKNRSIDCRTGREGPAHDPYGYTEFIVRCNNETIKLHMGLVEWLEIKDNFRSVARVHDDIKVLAALFEKATGIPPRKFERYYDRAHPYFDDPMGNPSDYI